MDRLFIATPSRFHGEMVRHALDRNMHAFCDEPFYLDVEQGGVGETAGLNTHNWVARMRSS
ncbi:Gfo/Idh/MocA family oxidoreductase [Bradyrhizobium sp. AZCC 1610]|uniref:Gfo/Idh/MocA family oxidoreductase n=1 Tax=Bradyrhizobium sp. AZCC 1610 TaxID=3117020 RepID=UPI003FA5BB6B